MWKRIGRTLAASFVYPGDRNVQQSGDISHSHELVIFHDHGSSRSPDANDKTHKVNKAPTRSAISPTAVIFISVPPSWQFRHSLVPGTYSR
jgi:hypothetical protein